MMFFETLMWLMLCGLNHNLIFIYIGLVATSLIFSLTVILMKFLVLEPLNEKGYKFKLAVILFASVMHPVITIGYAMLWFINLLSSLRTSK